MIATEKGVDVESSLSATITKYLGGGGEEADVDDDLDMMEGGEFRISWMQILMIIVWILLKEMGSKCGECRS